MFAGGRALGKGEVRVTGDESTHQWHPHWAIANIWASSSSSSIFANVFQKPVICKQLVKSRLTYAQWFYNALPVQL